MFWLGTTAVHALQKILPFAALTVGELWVKHPVVGASRFGQHLSNIVAATEDLAEARWRKETCHKNNETQKQSRTIEPKTSWLGVDLVGDFLLSFLPSIFPFFLPSFLPSFLPVYLSSLFHTCILVLNVSILMLLTELNIAILHSLRLIFKAYSAFAGVLRGFGQARFTSKSHSSKGPKRDQTRCSNFPIPLKVSLNFMAWHSDDFCV